VPTKKQQNVCLMVSSDSLEESRNLKVKGFIISIFGFLWPKIVAKKHKLKNFSTICCHFCDNYGIGAAEWLAVKVAEWFSGKRAEPA